MRTLFRLAPSLVCAFVVAGASGAACKHAASTTEGKPKKEEGVDVALTEKAFEAAHIALGAPKSAPRRSAVLVTGMLDFAPSKVARIGPSVGGRVGSVNVQPGQIVKKGAIVATIDSVDAGRARADLMAAKTRLAQSELELEREKRLLGSGASSDRAVRQAEAEKSFATSELRAAETRLQALGSGAGGGGGLALTSPMDGTVLEVRARMGQPVGPTDTLVLVGGIDPVWLRVDIYERDVAHVHAGDEARVTTVAYPDRVFSGHVDYVASALDPERRTLDARIVLDNADGALRPGMTAAARVVGVLAVPIDGGASTVITVPRSAMQTIDGQSFVFVEKEARKFELRGVERGSEIENDVEILRGLTGSEKIVVEGSFILKSQILKDQMGTND